MGRLESISSKKSLDWNVEKDGIKRNEIEIGIK